MTSREDSTYQQTRGSIPTDGSHLSSADETSEQGTQNGAYTPEEEALVEERLKNLGYL